MSSLKVFWPDNTLGWVAFRDGKYYGNSIAINPGPVKDIILQCLVDDIKYVLNQNGEEANARGD